MPRSTNILATGQWEGKAGAFGYQDRLGWVRVESGSESNVVGLPMELLAQMLARLNMRSAKPRAVCRAEAGKFILPIGGENATV